jgi:hypothetical protein
MGSYNYYPIKGLDILLPQCLYSGNFVTENEYDNII